MKTGTKVTWTTRDGLPGRGVTISDEQDGHVLVAVDVMRGEEVEVHEVIRCTVTWLTPAS